VGIRGFAVWMRGARFALAQHEVAAEVFLGGQRVMRSAAQAEI
jgi:hypothetical protein